MKFINSFHKSDRFSFLSIILFLICFDIALSLQYHSRSSNQASLGNLFEFLRAPQKEEKKEEPAKEEEKTSSNETIVDLTKPSGVLEDWLSIASSTFGNKRRYPDIALSNGNVVNVQQGEGHKRINENFKKAKKSGARTQYDFYTKMKSKYLFYSTDKDDINIIDSIYVKKIQNINNNDLCFNIESSSEDNFVLCGKDKATKLKWLCSIQQLLNDPMNPECPLPKTVSNDTAVNTTSTVKVRKNLKQMIIIPTPSPHCNENWNYLKHGEDWECQCKEGQEQSPIDLPIIEKSGPIKEAPFFNYFYLKPSNDSMTRMLYEPNGGYLKIVNNMKSFGKVVFTNGAVYEAKEILIHTPSEHTINGKYYDMEVQILHYGVSKGDIDKQVSLSFLFKSKPGVLNKFFEKLDYYNLPNPIDQSKFINNELFIPHLLDLNDDDDSISMKSFSFYQYNGSLSLPPCTERTTVLVASEPIEMSSTTIALFKEALRVPDTINENGQVFLGDLEEKFSNRAIQQLNGREVKYYNHLKYGCPEFIQKKKLKKRIQGHYEKRTVDSTEYFYVNGNKTSGIPGALVVPEKEAKEKGLITETN